MNTILQKRIEEAAKKYAKQFEQVGYDDDQIDTIEEAVIYGATLSLQNQWISVEGALPEKNVFVFVRGENTLGTFFNSDYIGCNGNWYLLSNYGTVPDRKITHWMPIPSLKGGEE